MCRAARRRCSFGPNTPIAGSLGSHYATYFGRSDIASPEEAVGGFVHHGVPVTKSVFHSNPTGVACSTNCGDPQAALAECPEFEIFCRTLSARGYEICVHAPEPRNASPDAGPRTAAWFARTFGAGTWIDHMARIVHCGMSAQGLNPGSEYCMARAWRDAGFRYFWQFASEDAAESINLQMPRWGDWLHTPLFWKHPTDTAEFISWPTIRGSYLHVFDEIGLDELLGDWGVCINHTYPPAHHDDPSRNEYFSHRDDGVLVTTAEFEDVLGRVGNLAQSGSLSLRCVREAVEYWEAIERVEISCDQHGRTVLVNRSDRDIAGFSFVVRGDVAPVPDARCRALGKDTIVTFDFRAGQTLTLSRPDRRLKTRATGGNAMIMEVAVQPEAVDYPEVKIDFGFDGSCHDRNHPMFESAQGMVRAGFIGEIMRGQNQGIVASLALKDYDYSSYVAAVRKYGSANAVREATKAQRAGYFVEAFPRALFIPDIYAINTSTPERGGVPMRSVYLRTIDEMGGAPSRSIALRPPDCMQHHQTYFGVFRPVEGYMQGAVRTDRQLLGYLTVNRYGNCGIYSTLLGHAAFLKNGIMSLLHFETIRTLLNPDMPAFNGLDYLMYHRYFNANPGLTFWKKKMIFQPVYWINSGRQVVNSTQQRGAGNDDGAFADMAPGPTAGNGDPFDTRRGIDTAGTVPLRELNITSPNVKFGLAYQTTRPQVLEDAVEFLGLNPADYTFVDLGSGKGRMLILAAELGFRQAIGVEFAPELVEIARANAAKLDLQQVSTWPGDAAEYAFPEGDLVLYMYNPFGGPVMEAVVGRLGQLRGREVFIVYRNPKCRAILEDCGFLDYAGVVPGWEGENGVHIWKTA